MTVPREFTYRKLEDITLGDSWSTMNLHEPQSYIPIYTTFFALNDVNFCKTTLNQKGVLEKIERNVASNIYECSVSGTTREVFFKEAPLLDTVKYLTGKYEMGDPNLFRLPTLSSEGEEGAHPKLNDPNNASYVDGLFAYLSSELLNSHNFFHGLDFYGSFLGIKHDYFIDVGDDIEILSDSDFFHRENGTHFFLESGIELSGDTRKNRPPLSISPTERSTERMIKISSSDELGALDDSPLANSDDSPLANSDDSPLAKSDELNIVFESSSNGTACGSACGSGSGSACGSDCGSACGSGSGSDCDSDTEGDTDSARDSACDSARDSGSGSGSGSACDSGSTRDDSLTEEESVFVTIPKFPIQAIALEKCVDTLDHHLLQNDVSDEELGSIVFQIVMTLITYQKAYDFTHNDLHTSNIMYKATDKTYICYKYEGRYYKVPTFGRIYKIIDFGRAIYKFRGKRYCSDSYHPEGDAASQYNCEPYYNEFKPVIEPNPSFDLCRLGCCLFDLLIDDMDRLDEESDIVRLIVNWCYDDKGRNILYKKSGAERYPEFKLYKMIARTVHRCVPRDVFKDEFFEQYLVSKKKLKQLKFFSVDEIPDYTTLI